MPDRSSAARGGWPTTASRPWWVRFPQRLADEVVALQAGGFTVTGAAVVASSSPLNDDGLPGLPPELLASSDAVLPDGWPCDAVATRDLVRLHRKVEARLGVIAHLPVVGDVALLVTFPDTYPWQPPRVFAPRLTAWTRHRDPLAGLLCLMPEEEALDLWRPEHTVAGLLAEQLPKIAAVNAGSMTPGELAAVEHPVGESLAAQLAGVAHVGVLVDSHWAWPARPWGEATLGVLGAPGQVFGALLDARLPEEDDTFGALDRRLASRFVRRVRVPWVRLDGLRRLDELFDDASGSYAGAAGGATLATSASTTARGRSRSATARPWSADRLWERAVQLLPEEGRPGALLLRRPQSQVPVLQVPTRTLRGRLQRTDWEGRSECLLVVVGDDELAYRDRSSGTTVLLLERWRATRRHRWQVRLARAEAAGPQDRFARVPSASPLRDSRVVVVGCGAVGGPAALQLAQSGLGRLTLFDGDVVTAATGSRQAQGLVDAGRFKVDVLALQCLEVAPYLDVLAHPYRLGAPGTHALLHRALADADLVIDAAANMALTRYLSAQVRDAGAPLLVASATGGGWGGTVVRLVPDGLCWACVEHWRADGVLPVPPALPGDELRPAGCSTATFTGSLLELQHVSLMTGRMAVDLLAGGDGLRGDVHTLALHDDDGPVPAAWSSTRLEQHPACPQHLEPAAGQLALPLSESDELAS